MKSKSSKDIIISKITLIKTYNSFKRKPKKIFVANDLFKSDVSHHRNRYLYTLKKLGLIEELKTIYFTGAKYKTKRDVKGYKLK